MISDMSLWLKLLLAMAFAAAVSFMMTPPVKRFAEKVGAIDIPKDERRVHDHPIPRMGGLAIFIGFVPPILMQSKLNQICASKGYPAYAASPAPQPAYQAAPQSNYQAPAAPAQPTAGDTADELRKLKSLLDDGIITPEEFDAKKKQLLGL